MQSRNGETALKVAQSQPRRRISSATWEQVKVAHASGVGLREIARNMDIPEGTVLARAKRHGWAKQIEVAKTKAPALQSNAITPAEAAANVLSTRKDKSRLNLSKYVTDASQTAAKSQGDLTIARQVKDVAAVHSTLWPEEPQQSKGTLAPLSIYSERTIVAMPAPSVSPLEST